MVERKLVTGQGYGLGIGGCKRLCFRGCGVGLGYTTFPAWSVKDRSLHKASWASHRLIIPSTYLGMGAWKTCCSLVVGSGSFRTDCPGFVLVEEVFAPH